MPVLLLGEEFRARIRPLQRIDEIGLHRNVRLGDEIGVMPLAEHLRGLVVKTHGSSKSTEVCNSIIQCVTFKEQKINEKIKECLDSQAQEIQ